MNILEMAALIAAKRPGIEPPTPLWEVTLRLLYGLPLAREQIATASEITGRSEYAIREYEGHAFRELWCRVGRRGRKSSTAALIAVFEAIYGGHEQSLMPGELGLTAIVSRDTAGAKIVVSFACAFLDALGIEHRSTRMGNMHVEELDGVRLNIGVLTSTSTAPRGFAIPCAVLDELAHWQTAETAANPDKEIIAALRPAMRQFSNRKLVAISSPLAKDGVHYDVIEETLENDAERVRLAVTGATWEWNPSLTEAGCREDERDEAVFEREYRAIPGDKSGSQFFSAAAIDKATLLPSLDPEGSDVFAAGGDFAFKSDASAQVVVRRVGNRYEVVHVEELRPGIFGPLKPSKVCKRFAGTAQRFGVRCIMCDGHYSESIREHLAEHDIALVDAPTGTQGKLDVHMVVRDLIHEERVSIPPNEGELLAQLKGIVGKPTSAGTAISSPRRGGRHGDIASACILAIYSATQTGSAPIARGPYLSPDAFWYGTPGRGFG